MRRFKSYGDRAQLASVFHCCITVYTDVFSPNIDAKPSRALCNTNSAYHGFRHSTGFALSLPLVLQKVSCCHEVGLISCHTIIFSDPNILAVPLLLSRTSCASNNVGDLQYCILSPSTFHFMFGTPALDRYHAPKTRVLPLFLKSQRIAAQLK